MSQEEKRNLREQIKWVVALLQSMETCLNGDNVSGVWKYGGYRQFARKYNQIVSTIAEETPLPKFIEVYNLEKIPGPGDTIAFQQKDLFESVHVA